MSTIGVPITQLDLRYLKGVGPKRAQIFQNLGIHSVEDLLRYFPRRYEDRSCYVRISDIQPGQIVTIKGEIVAAVLKRFRGITLLDVAVGDDSGVIHMTWFNQPYLKPQMEPGRGGIFYGKADLRQGKLQLSSPEYEFVEDDEDTVHTMRITPVYPLTQGLFQRSLRTTIYDVVHNQLDQQIVEYLPEEFIQNLKLMGLREAIREMHFPTSLALMQKARERIVFDELFFFELLIFKKIDSLRSTTQAMVIRSDNSTQREFANHLPFDLTAGQKEALTSIAADMGQPYPMNRLLQGDVGSGKTVVAAFALLLAAQSKHQAAFLVPTEILAEQHYHTIRSVLAPFKLAVGLLTSNTPLDRRQKMLAELKQGKVSILIGTHALFQEDVHFASLALLVIDEQHKFGVHQRHHLLNRHPRPHQLVMTATPIPRTLALTVFGDLDVSVMKELPSGRQPIATYWITRKKQPDVLRHILEKIETNHEQAYFIYPSIEETENHDLQAAKKGYEKLRKDIFLNIKVGLVHGKLDRDDREYIMRSFKEGEIKVLVATSVVEVGVDNPNATMMVIENAERFGLSQLHQMRGRVGRGQRASECFLFGEPKTEEGKRRLRVLTKTHNGFVIAEEDLKLRGPGEFLGTRQSGEPLFKTADLINDQEILLRARDAANRIVKQKLLTESSEWSLVRQRLENLKFKY
jgi:ATP-dependent DNA helicase RecG